MLVFWKQRLVYLATPKTGSAAIEAALEPLASIVVQRPPILKHTSARRYGKYLAPYLVNAAGESFMVVAVMREPVDWLGSWYRYRQRHDGVRSDHSTHDIDFTRFVEGYLSDPPAEFARVGTQSGFLLPEKGPGVDRIFRYDDMPRFVEFLEERLDCEITLPRRNVSPKAATDLDPAVEARLRVASAADFALYDSLAGPGV